MLIRFAHIAVIIIMLVSQGAEAFTTFALPCAQKHVIALNIVDSNSQSAAHMAMQLNGEDESCCQPEGCCPDSLVNIAVLINNTVKTFPEVCAARILFYEPEIRTLYLMQLHRPPIIRLI